MADENSKWSGHERKGYYPQNHPENHEPKIIADKSGHKISKDGYSMPALRSEVFFWQQAEDLRKLLSKEKYVLKFFESHPTVLQDVSHQECVRLFGEWVLSVAQKASEKRREPDKVRSPTT